MLLLLLLIANMLLLAIKAFLLIILKGQPVCDFVIHNAYTGRISSKTNFKIWASDVLRLESTYCEVRFKVSSNLSNVHFEVHLRTEFTSEWCKKSHHLITVTTIDWMKWRGNKYLPLKLWMPSKQCWLWCQNKAKWLSKQESHTLIYLKRTLVVCFTSNSHDFRLAIWTALDPLDY